MIYVDLLASSCNHNGGGNGLTAPNGEAQIKLLNQALKESGLKADDIQFVEAHGTGTKLGDPIEVQAINQVYGLNKTIEPLCIGSAKANFGHLEAAAGILSVIKVIACMVYKVFPPQANFSIPNDYIDWSFGRAKVIVEPQPWPLNATGCRYASVSSFGITGTNSHVILSQPKATETSNLLKNSNNYQQSLPLIFSAKNSQSLRAILNNYSQFLTSTDSSLEDISYTLANGREHFDIRAGFCADSLGDAKKKIEHLLEVSNNPEKAIRKIVFCFTGQGAQYLKMGYGLYQRFEVFKNAIDEISVLFEHERKQDLRALMWGDEEDILNDTKNAQPALFAYEYALYKLWIAIGVKPGAVIGHSLGEYVAAYVAGVLTLEDAFKLVLFRSSAMSELPRDGGMLSIRAGEEVVLQFLKNYDNLEICAINSANITVVGGSKSQLKQIRSELDSNNIISIELNVSHAFHTKSMTPVMKKLIKISSEILMSKPVIPLLSNITGSWLTEDDLRNDYWAKHLRQPVNFFSGIKTLNHADFFDFLEVGPQGVLSNIISSINNKNHKLSNFIMGDEVSSIYQTATTLFNSSLDIDWSVLFATSNFHKVRLPTYQFNLSSYWLENSLEDLNSKDNTNMKETQTDAKLNSIEEKIIEIFSELLSISHKEFDTHKSLLEMGVDSFVLVMAIKRLKESFEVEMSVRDIFEKYFSIEKISKYILEQTPLNSAFQIEFKDKESIRPIVLSQNQTDRKVSHTFIPPTFTFDEEGDNFDYATKTVPKIGSVNSSLTPRQQQYMMEFTARYNKKTAKSKQRAQKYRSVLCNNRKSSSGFRVEIKDLSYPIQSDRSYGSKIVDIDGNEYIDLAMGFGATLFGHKPDFIETRLHEQLSKGYQIGPESHLAGECAKMICNITEMDRVLFTNSGTEAVMTAIRIARAYNKRKKVVVFQNAYHGHYDSTLCMPNVEGEIGDSKPMALGTPFSLVEDIIVLPFNAESSLEYILANHNDISAVITEPVQNRDPGMDTASFLRKLRNVTKDKGIILIFDEVLVGFRIALKGAQHWFGVNSDIATYGKIIGGGLPIGVVAGRKGIMDIVDGGFWEFNDNSVPNDEVTYTAGTFCKHPLAMTSCHAVLNEMINRGPKLQETLNQKTDKMISIFNEVFNAHHVPLQAKNFGSFFRIAQQGNLSFVYQPLELDIFFYHLIEKGVYVWEGKTCFLSTAHTQQDIQKIINAVNESIVEMKQAGFWPDTLEIDDDYSVGQSQNLTVTRSEKLTAKKSISSSVLNRAMRKRSDVLDSEENFEYVTQYPDSIADESFLAKVNDKNQMDFGVYFFGDDDDRKIEQIIDIAEYIDQSGLQSLWLPERHFNRFAGFSPNPAIIGSAIASKTKTLKIRASVLAPLRHPISIAEEWSILDNISQGRVGVAMASGWFVNDFVLNPSAWGKQRKVMLDNMNAVQHLWKGKKLSLPSVDSKRTEVELFPRPIQDGLPMWLTTLGNKQNYIDAGIKGIGILTNMIGQKVSDLAENIALYKKSREKAGFDPNGGHITVLMHTLITDDKQTAIEIAREPFIKYLSSSVGLFQKMVDQEGLEANFDSLSDDDRLFLLNSAYERYIKGSALIGDVSSCINVVESLKDIGVNEIACFVDFGVPSKELKAYLPNIVKLNQHYNKQKNSESSFLSPIVIGESGLTNNLAKKNEQLSVVQKLPLTDDQKMLWFISKISTDGMLAYSQSSMLRLQGELDIVKLQKSADRMIERHDALRTIINIDGEYQTILPNYEMPIEQFDLSLIEGTSCDSQLEQLVKTQANKKFDFSQPLIRLSLIKVSEHTHYLILTAYHLVCDGVSIGVFLNELADTYNSYLNDSLLELPPVLQFSEFVTWRNTQYKELEYQREQVFWLKEIAEQSEQMLALPFDFLRPAVKTYTGSRLVMTINKEMFSRLKEFAQKNHITYFMVVLAAFYCLLYRLCRQQQITVGVPFSGRTLKDSERTIGYLSNVYPIIFTLNDNETIAKFLVRLRNKLLDAFSNQNYPFSSLIENVKGQKYTSQSPFFNVAFNWDKLDIPDMKNLDIDGYNLKPNYVEYDLMVNILEVNNEAEISWDFNSSLFKETTISYISEQFREMLTNFIEDSEQIYAQVRLEVEPTQLKHPQPRVTSSDIFSTSLLEECSRDYGNRVAVRCKDDWLDYSNLNDLATKFANVLQSQGVKKGDCVALCLAPSIAQIVAVHGVIKLGAYYLPLNTRYPGNQLQDMVEDAQAKIVVRAQEQFEDIFPDNDEKVLILDKTCESLKDVSQNQISVKLDEQDTVYIIYTSGSSGKPKGVQVTHLNLSTFCQSALNRLEIDGSETFLNVSSFAFDMSTPDIFLPLRKGGSLIIATEEQRLDPIEIIKLIDSYKIGFMQATPTVWKGLIENGFKGHKDMVCCLGGEMLPSKLARQFELESLKVFNGYGPTETTVWSNLLRIKPEHLQASLIPVGQPLDNSCIYIVDKNMQLVPTGHCGEVLIGGLGVAKGYVNQQQLSEEKFIKNLWGGGSLYRTGDLGRWDPSVGLILLGRVDNQVKIRGFRIELDEIEAVLSAHPDVSQAAVITQQGLKDNLMLVGFVELHNGSLKSGQDIRTDIKRQLPDYMVPTIVKVMDHLPRSGNDKIDRRALPIVDINLEGMEYVPPGNDEEKRLCELIGQLVGRKDISVTGDFFELGGTSLDLARLQQEIQNEFHCKVSITELFIQTTARNIAKIISHSDKDQTEDTYPSDSEALNIDRTLHQSNLPMPLLPAVRYHFEHVGYSNHLNLVKLFDLLDDCINEKVVQHVVDTLIRSNEVLTISIGKSEEGELKQYLGSVSPQLESIDFSNIQVKDFDSKIELYIANLQQSFLLEVNQPLVHFVFFKTPEELPNRFLILCHFALIDAYGMELLSLQFSKLLNSYINNSPIKIFNKTTYSEWFKAYIQFANQKAQEDLSYWLNLPWYKTAKLNFAHIDNPQTQLGRFYNQKDYIDLMAMLSGRKEGTLEQIRALSESNTIYMVSLTALQTAKLKKVIDETKLEMVDVLLAAFYLTLKPNLSETFLPVDFMFSNRKPMLQDINVSETVMRAAENIVLPIDVETTNLLDATKEISKQRNELPNSGLSLPALRCLNTDALILERLKHLPLPQVGFNYLSLWSKQETIFEHILRPSENLCGSALGNTIDHERGIWLQLYIDESVDRIDLVLTYDAHRLTYSQVEELSRQLISILDDILVA